MFYLSIRNLHFIAIVLNNNKKEIWIFRNLASFIHNFVNIKGNLKKKEKNLSETPRSTFYYVIDFSIRVFSYSHEMNHKAKKTGSILEIYCIRWKTNYNDFFELNKRKFSHKQLDLSDTEKPCLCNFTNFFLYIYCAILITINL